MNAGCEAMLNRRRFLTLATLSGTALPMLSTPLRAGDTGSAEAERSSLVTLFLCGDVMTGRGIDQVLPHPGDPTLYEQYVDSALDYVALAEQANGPITKPVDFAYVWGDALAELARRRPDARIVNLETAVTRSAEPARKEVNYRMTPQNAPVITAAGVDCCVLANNHVLDWGRTGLLETLETLEKAGVKAAGAGRTLSQAAAPAVLPGRGGGRTLVFAFGSGTAGVPRSWAATDDGPGVSWLPDLSHQTVEHIAGNVDAAKRQGDLVVASIHWGSNWGYDVADEQIAFAHGLIDDAGVDVVHGHSSHHPRPIEVYRGKPILYGCGDFLNDYEGIPGYEAYRGDLTLMYFPTVDASTGLLHALAMVPLQLRRFRLHHASPADAAWLRDTLTREGQRFATRVESAPDGALALVWR